MSKYDELLNEDPRDAKSAKQADETLEAAVRKGMEGFSTLNSAVESGKKYSWTLLVVIFGIAAFIVKSTLFYAEYSQNQATAKDFRESTTARLDAMSKAQAEKELADRKFSNEQTITNNRLTDLVAGQARRLEILEDRK